MLQGFTGADWGDEPASVCTRTGSGLFNPVELNWSLPRRWQKGDTKPSFDTDEPFLYILLRDHGNSRTKDQIVYVGLTKAPSTRFGNHETAKAIVAKRGTVRFTYAPVDLRGRNRLERVGRALEELEHLLIWAVPGEHLVNERKQFTLPGMGSRGGNAWHVQNTGYRFSGQMPREIVFPWMMVRPGRNRSLKSGLRSDRR
jgi:predicted GIY-YIG superfamily endonuclease